jgi:hypothetical protein
VTEKLEVCMYEKFRCDGKVESLKKKFETKLGLDTCHADVFHRLNKEKGKWNYSSWSSRLTVSWKRTHSCYFFYFNGSH